MTLYGGITVYDGVMALIVFFTMVHGFWKGATWQIAPIMSLVLGYMIAMPMSVTTAHYFGDPPQNRSDQGVKIGEKIHSLTNLMNFAANQPREARKCGETRA